jgi:hypothetical protein
VGITCSGPGIVKRGELIQVQYEIDATGALTVGLGAEIYDTDGGSHANGDGDNHQLRVNEGTTPGTRSVRIPADLEPGTGTYELALEVWPANKIGQGEALVDQPCVVDGRNDGLLTVT